MLSKSERSLRTDALLHRVWQVMGRPAGCRVVGGYVRDRLLERHTKDLDLAIDGSARSAEAPARRLAAALGVHTHLLGTAPHRVWRIETPELTIELWPTGGLKVEDDIRRRDFTINALAWPLPDGPLVDLVGGLEDLSGQRLRAIARSNFEADPVRLVRAPRFLSQLPGFEIDGETRGWITELGPRLADAPRERVGRELMALLAAPAAARGLQALTDLGLLRPSAPRRSAVDELWLERNLGAIDILNSGSRTGKPPSSQTADIARLGFLFRAWGLPEDREIAPYAWPKEVRDRARRAARRIDDAVDVVSASPADRRELMWRAGDAFPALFALARSIAPDRTGWRRWKRQWQRNPESLMRPKPLFTGDEISSIAGIPPGPDLGELVDRLLRAQVRGEVRTRGGAVAWLCRRC